MSWRANDSGKRFGPCNRYWTRNDKKEPERKREEGCCISINSALADSRQNGGSNNETQLKGIHQERNSAVGDAGFKYKDFVNEPELEHLGMPIYPSYADNDDGGEAPQMVDFDNKPESDAADT